MSGLAYEAQDDKVGHYIKEGTVNEMPYWRKAFGVTQDVEDQAFWYDAANIDWEAGPISALGTDFGGLSSDEKSTPCPTGLSTPWWYATNRSGEVEWIKEEKLVKVFECRQNCSEFMWINEGGTMYGNEAIENCDWEAEMTKTLHKWHAMDSSYCLVIHYNAAVQMRETNAIPLAEDEKICEIPGWAVFGLKDCHNGTSTKHSFKKFGDGGWSNLAYMLVGDCERVECPDEKGCYKIIKAKGDCL